MLVYNGSAYVEGLGRPRSPPTALRLALDVGVVGALVAAQEVLPAMRAAGRGTVLLTGSVAADRGSDQRRGCRGGQGGAAQPGSSLHKEVAGDGVRAGTVTIDGVLSGPTALDVERSRTATGRCTPPRAAARGRGVPGLTGVLRLTRGRVAATASSSTAAPATASST